MSDTTTAPPDETVGPAPLTEEQLDQIHDAFEELGSNGYLVKLVALRGNLAVEVHAEYLDPDDLTYLLTLAARNGMRAYVFRTKGDGMPLMMLQPERVSADTAAAPLTVVTDTTADEEEPPRFTVTELEEDSKVFMRLAIPHGDEVHLHNFEVPSPELAELTWEAAEEVGRRITGIVDPDADPDTFKDEFVRQTALGAGAIERAARAAGIPT